MKKYIIPIILSAAFFFMCLATISEYGISCDAPIHMLRGQAIAQFFLTGKKTYNQPPRVSPILIKPGEYASRYFFSAEETIGGKPANLPQTPLVRKEFENLQKQSGQRFSFYTSNYWNGNFFFNLKPSEAGHPPLIDTLSAFSNRLLYGSLGILGDIESYELVYILVSACGVFLISYFAYQIGESFGLSVRQRLVLSFIAGVTLALLPKFIEGAHSNMKDPEETVFFMGSIWAFWNWIRQGRMKWYVISTIFVTLAFCVKWNIVFLPFILVPWVFMIRKTKLFHRWFHLKKLFVLSVFSIFSIIIFFSLTWPYTWSDPIGKFIATGQFYSQIGIAVTALQPNGFIYYGFNFMPTILLLVQNPEVTLILFMAGFYAFYRRKLSDEPKTYYLLSCWFLVPLLRISIPPFKAYGGLRQIDEIFPAISLIAALGAEYLISLLQKKFLHADIFLCGLFLVLLAIPVIRLHPYEGAYSNVLHTVTTKIFGRDVVSWVLSDSSAFYKESVQWLNVNAPKNAKLGFVDGCYMAISPLWLRPDMSFSPNFFSGLAAKGEYIITDFDNAIDPPVFASRYLYRFLNPIHIINIGHQINFYTYKNDPAYLKTGYTTQKKITYNESIVESSTGDYIEINLPEKEKITKITAVNAPPVCTENNWGTVIDFLRPNLSNTELLDNTYAINEREVLPDRKVEFSFPGSPATMIRIYPQNNRSCFASGKVGEIDALKQ